MGQLFDEAYTLVRRAAAEQGGIISGDNPTNYNAADPLRLWVIQVGIIVTFTQLLAIPFARIRQPRVIAEVIGGVLLGPSVMGRIPNFTQRIFPAQSIPLLTLTANIGLVFFLFLVGLEIDTRLMRRNARAAMSISAAGLILPFGLGAALAVPLYNQFVSDTVNRGYFILFVAVAIGITAFPVLCRILTETRLLDTTVGVVTLSAGVGNDVIGWVLLALSVALVNASSGLTALWVLLAGLGYVLFLLFPVKFAFKWLARKTGSLESGQPSTTMMTITFLLVLVSAFFTDIIGIHAIFGGFVAGLIIPHEGGFAIALVEKLEDLVSLIFLPLYFTISGFNTDLGLLNDGITWGYVVLICTIAFFGKFVGCFTTAKLFGFSWRESGAIGSLMACKGLVELIVLNVGRQANILDARLFSMFVLHAIVLTFLTTPLTLLWYPEHIRTKASGKKTKVNDTPGLVGESGPFEGTDKTNFTVVLNRVEHLAPLMTLTQLLQRPINFAGSKESRVSSEADGKASAFTADVPIVSETTSGKEKFAQQSLISISALRLIELTERTSAVLKSQEASAQILARADPLLSVFRTFGRLHRVAVHSALAVIGLDEFAGRVSALARECGAHMVVVPWNMECVASGEENHGQSQSVVHNPFENIFSKNTSERAFASQSPAVPSVVYSSFVRKIFADSPADVALFVDRSSSEDTDLDVRSLESGGCHLFLPFFGGPDDRLALDFVVQLCANPSVTATVLRVEKTESHDVSTVYSVDHEKFAALANFTIHGTANADTLYGIQTTETRLKSETADNILWARYSSRASQVSLPNLMQEALSRITFHDAASPRPLHHVLERSYSRSLGRTSESGNSKSMIAVVGRGRRMAQETHRGELKELLLTYGVSGAVGGELSRTMGDVAAAFVASSHQASVLVLQAAHGRAGSV